MEFKVLIDKLYSLGRNLGYDVQSYYEEKSIVIKYYMPGYHEDENKRSLANILGQDKNFKKYLSKFNITLEQLSMTQDFSKYSDLVLTLFNDEEPEKGEIIQLSDRKKRGYPTLPFLVLSSDFLNIPDYESFGFMKILEIIEKHTDIKPVALCKEDLINKTELLNQYFYLIGLFAKTLKMKEMIFETEKKLTQFVKEISQAQDKGLSFSFKRIRLSEFRKVLDICQNMQETCDGIIEECFHEVAELQKRNKKEILEKKTNFKHHTYDSNISRDIRLKYGDFIDRLNKFSEYVSSKYNLKDDYYIKERLKSQNEYLNISGEMAIIGTFSSGKTTLINSLLSIKHNLRTSSAHNTAVLLKLYSAYMDQEEYYDLKYKDKVEVYLVSETLSDELMLIYEYDEEAIVTGVDHEKRVIHIKYTLSKEDYVIYVQTRKEIIVRKSQCLKKGDKLTKGADINYHDSNIKCMSSDELTALEEAYKKGQLKNVRVKIDKKNDSIEYSCDEAMRVVEGLKSLNAKRDQIIPIDKLKHIGYEGAYRIKFSAKLDMKDQKTVLDQRGWQEFGSDSDTFLESPKCYLFAKEINAYLHSGFLEYCHLVDTPGFGSVTEKHDAISERYLRKHNGTLVVMIKINHKTLSESLDVLLNKIDAIYDNASSLKKNEVYFLLNCFRRNASEEHIINTTKRVHEEIVKRGFSKEKIYAFNLKHAIEKNEFKDEMYNLPSYKKFYCDVKTDIETNSIVKAFLNIQKLWDDFFEEQVRIHEIENRAKSKDKREKAEKKTEAINKRKIISEIRYPSFDEIRECYIDDEIKMLRKLIEGLSKKKEWKQQKETVFSLIDIITENHSCSQGDAENDMIFKFYVRAMGDIQFHADLHDDNSSMNIRQDKVRCLVISAETFKGLYEEILDHRAWGLFSYKNNEFREELLNYFNDEVESSLEEIKKDYYPEALNKFKGYKYYALSLIDRQLDELYNEAPLDEVIKLNKSKINDYKDLGKQWHEISEIINEKYGRSNG